LVGKERRERELSAEMDSHIQMHIEENLHAGMSPREARRDALIKLGGVEPVKESYRERRGLPMLETLWHDFRFGARVLRKNAGFAAVVILTLALGIGANTAIFTLTYAVILKSLPVPNPSQLVRYTFRNGQQDIGLSGPLYDALRTKQSVNTDLLAWSGVELALEENGNAESVTGALMSGNGFRVLELQPVLGRTFSEADDVPGGGPAGYQAVLGYNYWKTHFQKDPAVLGKSLLINKRTVSVIGILPEGFEGLIVGRQSDMVLPLSFEEVTHAPRPQRHDRGSFWLTVLGRLKPGESLRSAQANLAATHAAVREEADPTHHYLGGFFASFQFGVESGRGGRSFLRMNYGQPLVVLEILVALLLLLCCANTALLVLARVSGRLSEFSLRSALGAGRARLFQQVLCEVGLLAACGLVAGAGLGWAAARSLVSMLAAIGEPPPLDVSPQLAILGFTAGISVLSAMAAGLWPALRASRVAPGQGLKEADARSSARRVGKWTVPAQVAVSITLLTAAWLLGGAFLHLLLDNSGFRTSGVTIGEVDLRSLKAKAPEATQNAKLIVEALQNTPGIEAAAVFNTPPIHDWWSASHYFSIGANGSVHSDMQSWEERVSPGFFAAMGIPILEGRGFSRGDEAGEQVCVLSASSAAYFFPGASSVSQFVYGGGEDPKQDGKLKVDPSDTCRVIGVAGDAKFRSLRETSPRMLYRPVGKDDLRAEFFVAVRSGNSTLGVSSIREAVHQVIPAAIPPRAYSFGELVATHLRQERMLMSLSLCFAGIALLLTSVGLYGVLARSVVIRTKEIGIRLALGARPGDALRLVVRQGMGLVLVGTMAGLAGAMIVTRVLRHFVDGVESVNVPALAGAVTLLVAVTLTASYFPARKAARVDPVIALRQD
jgi:predicted permease